MANPIVNGDRLYVANLLGEVKALDKVNGSELWSIHQGIPFVRDFVVGRRAPYDDLIVLTDYLGRVVIARDTGTSGEWSKTIVLDETGTVRVSTSPVIDDVNGFVHVGAIDGRIYQVALANHGPASRAIAAHCGRGPAGRRPASPACRLHARCVAGGGRRQHGDSRLLRAIQHSTREPRTAAVRGEGRYQFSKPMVPRAVWRDADLTGPNEELTCPGSSGPWVLDFIAGGVNELSRDRCHETTELEGVSTHSRDSPWRMLNPILELRLQ
jgi:hypothetical protein